MKLLIITQKVDKNDPFLGFFHGWIEEFSKYCEELVVICLEAGDYSLPENVKILSLGKEKMKWRNGWHKIGRLIYIFNFYKYIFNYRNLYNFVFVHMNPEYVVFGGLFWKILRKDIYLWYVHRQVNFILRIAHLFVDKILTAVPESFGIKSNKVLYLGHGINTSQFYSSMKLNFSLNNLCILHVGRITPIKNIEVAINAVSHLSSSGSLTASLRLVGLPVTKEDDTYKKSLDKLIKVINPKVDVSFVGDIPNQALLSEYCACDVTVNMTPTGGLDKVVFESLAANRPVFTSNKAFEDFFGEYAGLFIFQFKKSEDLAHKIKMFLALSEKDKTIIINTLHDRVVSRYDTKSIIVRIINILNGV